MTPKPLRLLAATACLSLLLSGCADDEGEAVEPTEPVERVAPASRDAGIQLTGMLDGRRVAVSRGAPIVTLGDCDPIDGQDEDLCIAARTIDGLDITLVIENPAALVAGTTMQVDDPACVRGCDNEPDIVVATIRLLDEDLRVSEGTFEIREAGPRYIADFDLRLPFGDRLIGTFDVIPAS